MEKSMAGKAKSLASDGARARIARWDARFLTLARHIAGWSKDPSTQVGAVVASPRLRIVSTGYNGLPAGVEDTLARLEDRALKYELMVHAERNAIIDARQNLAGCTLYVWPMPPCSQCAAMIIQTGLARVVTTRNENPRWEESVALALEMFAEAGVELLVVEADALPATDGEAR